MYVHIFHKNIFFYVRILPQKCKYVEISVQNRHLRILPKKCKYLQIFLLKLNVYGFSGENVNIYVRTLPEIVSVYIFCEKL